jgi:hypothetical protein
LLHLLGAHAPLCLVAASVNKHKSSHCCVPFMLVVVWFGPVSEPHPSFVDHDERDLRPGTGFFSSVQESPENQGLGTSNAQILPRTAVASLNRS